MWTIRNILHRKGHRLVLHDDAKAVPPAAVDKLRRMLAFLQNIATPAEMHAIPIWKAHRLAGSPRRLEPPRHAQLETHLPGRGNEIVDVDLEDYH